jgi:exosortase/archaeosortase family protein
VASRSTRRSPRSPWASLSPSTEASGPAATEMGDAMVDERNRPGGNASLAWGRAARFCGLFVLLIALYAAVFQTPFVERRIHAPVSRVVTLVCLPVLAALGNASVTGTDLEFDGFRATVVEACNGVLPTYIFLAAVVAFPSRWRAKLWGALIGIPLIFSINVVRVVSLMILGARRPSIVERVHIDVWQTAVVVLAMGIWIFWVERFVRR